VTEREDATRRVSELTAAYDRLATAMYTVDTHPAWNRAGLASGRTRQVLTELRPQVDRLWAYFGALGERLEKARSLLAVRRLGGVPPELATLLTGPAVGLDQSELPVDGSTTPVTTIPLADLAERGERGVALVLGQLSDVDRSAAALAEPYIQSAAEVDAVATLAVGLGETELAQRLRDGVAEIERIDVSDPLTAAPSGQLASATRSRLDQLAGAVTQARAQLDQIASVRDSYPQRRAALVAAIDQVEAAEAGVAAAYARAGEKIADPGLGPLPAAAVVLRARLTELDGLRDSARWPRLSTDMSTVEAETQRARARAAELAALADGLLARRDELRGRLEAYRAKAVASGLAEDTRLAGLFSQAHDLLYTAPCDLRAATRAVYAYQSGLVSQSLVAPERSAVDAVDE
jgi:hypothetical protein